MGKAGTGPNFAKIAKFEQGPVGTPRFAAQRK